MSTTMFDVGPMPPPVRGGFMRAILVLLMTALVACGGARGEVTGRPEASLAPSLQSVVEEPTTTTVPATSSEAFDHLMSVRIDCGRQPASCDVASFVLEGTPLHTETVRLMHERAAAGVVASDRGSVKYRIDRVVTDGDSSRVTTCVLDDVVLTMDGAIFDDSRYSAIIEWTIVDTMFGPRWTDRRVVSSSVEEDLCGFSE
jgi:hypothetical protein